MWVIQSNLTEAADNLALEEALFEAAPDIGGVLFFCRNRPAVVIGKNQNPWRECRVERLAGQGVRLIRRISGGGTVYHDEGNLNYSLMLSRAAYDRDRCFAWVLAALQTCGIPSQRQGTTSLGVQGRKFSGTSFAYRKNSVLHHGTFLLQSDLDRLTDAVQRPAVSVEGHAVDSEPATVMNLCEMYRDLTMARLAAALESALPSFFDSGPLVPQGPECMDPARWKPLARRNRTVAWRFGRTPPFSVFLGCPGEWGLDISVRADRISRARFHVQGAQHEVRLPWTGLRFRPSRLAVRAETGKELPREHAASVARGLYAGWKAPRGGGHRTLNIEH